jgi:thioredoxin 1
VVKVDIDASPDLAQRFGVMSVPTLAVFKGGKLVNQAVGVQPKPAIMGLLGM